MSQDRKLTLFYHFNKVAGHRTLEQLIQAIQGNHFKDQVARIRHLAAKGKSQQASNLKKQLPAFTVSGHFNRGRTLEHLVEYTHFIVLDFDKLEPTQLEKLKSESRQDRFSMAGFTSPSGNGYKIAVQVDSEAENHIEAFQQVRSWFRENHSLEIDRSGKDITRLCFLSHDPKAWFNPSKEIFPVLTALSSAAGCHSRREPAHVSSACPPRKEPTQIPQANEQPTTLNELLKLTQSQTTYTPGNRNNFLYLFASNANRAGIFEADTLTFAQSQFTDLDDREIRQTITSAYKNHTAEHATAACHPRRGPATSQTNNNSSSPSRELTMTTALIPDSSSLIPVSTDLNDLLLTTPLLDDQIFLNLPSPLLEGCQAFDDPRERDVFLTGALAVLSGCLTGIEGVYDRRTTYPNLFAFIIAPAASGKSALTFAKQLGDAVHKSLLQENELAIQQYRQELADYKLLMSNYKLGKTLPQEPEKPPFKVLFIPANSSSAMVIKHLRDGGGTGIMCETEADTLGNVLKQDWGGYSDLLRKAFHFEKISYSRKGSNEFFEIDQPRLSVAISGTPNQILKLIPSVEDGLFSRFLFYCYAVQPNWRDVSPAPGGINLTEHFAQLSERTLEITCFTSENPVLFHLTTDQWQRLNEHFTRLLQETNAFFGTESLSSIKRLGAILFRIAMTLTACRRFENADGSTIVTCDEADFQAASLLVEAYLRHAMFLFEKLPREAVSFFNTMPNNKRLFIENLPTEFRRKDAVEIGEGYGLSRATVDRMLETLTGSYFDCAQHGVYSKR
ncbi:MAG: DUF3987 domain-containing protein [Saprospiraceae bacterium]|nr:DUF3987 domain-containing protein [Bacteroidota bacterium]MCB9313985.1 DUF3987 domain-containing protein [Lewinellaceae bacterium]